MIRKDYIQRYFDELAKVLAAVLQLKNDLRPEEAEEKLNSFSSDFLNISLTEIIDKDANQVIDFLIKQKEFTLTHFKLLESILYNNYLLTPKNSKLKEITLTVLNHTLAIDSNYVIERIKRLEDLNN